MLTSEGRPVTVDRFPDWSHEDYWSYDAINRSRIVDLLKDPARFEARHEAKVLPDEETAALRFGRLFHRLVLEPGRWNAEVAVEPASLNKTTKAGKAWAEAAIAAGKTVVSAKDAALLMAMRRSLLAEPASHDINRKIVQAALRRGRTEVGYVWEDYVTGIRCKALLDIVDEDRQIIVDLKSTAGDSPDRIAWSSWKDYLYHLQDAWYSEPLRRLGRAPRFFLVFVPKAPPHTPVVVEYDDELRAEGRELMRRGLDELAIRRREGNWLADWQTRPITVGRRGWKQ